MSQVKKWWKKIQRWFRKEFRDPVKEKLEETVNRLEEVYRRFEPKVAEDMSILTIVLINAILSILMGRKEKAREELKEVWRKARARRDEILNALEEVLLELQKSQ